MRTKELETKSPKEKDTENRREMETEKSEELEGKGKRKILSVRYLRVTALQSQKSERS